MKQAKRLQVLEQLPEMASHNFCTIIQIVSMPKLLVKNFNNCRGGTSSAPAGRPQTTHSKQLQQQLHWEATGIALQTTTPVSIIVWERLETTGKIGGLTAHLPVLRLKPMGNAASMRMVTLRRR
jgi:hypothetical protein